MKSPLGIALILAGVVFAGLAVACSGLDTGDLVRVPVNDPVRKAQGTAPVVSLNEAYTVYEDYLKDGERFAAEIQDAEERRSFLDSLVNMGVEVAVPYLGELPVGGFAVSTLVGIGMLLVGKKAGETKTKAELQPQIKEAEDRGWDQGEASAIEKVRTGVDIAKGA